MCVCARVGAISEPMRVRGERKKCDQAWMIPFRSLIECAEGMPKLREGTFDGNGMSKGEAKEGREPK